jgi:predicted O-methyltransferase YrrM
MSFTKESLDIVEKISNEMEENTFHHHYHILYDLSKEFNIQSINYVEIGCYAGGSSCLMIQKPNTNVISIDLDQPTSSDIVKRNVDKFNKLSNPYTYLQGNSQTNII